MADVSVRMGVSGVSQFTQAMQQAQNSVKTIDAALKKNEAQFKATGNAQDYMGQKTDLLKQKLASQKTAAANASQALAQMVQNGVDPASREYQKLAQAMLNAETAAIETETQINHLGTASTSAAKQTDNLESSLQGLNKKVSLQQVIQGIDSITGGLEKAAKKAVELGTKIWDNIMDSAAYADDTATMATRMGLTVEEVQQMQYVANRFEAPVETVAKTWKKLKMNMTSDTDDVVTAFKKLGVAQSDVIGYGKYGDVITEARNYKDVFWEVGDAIMRVTDEAEQERLAQTLLGRSWDELSSLFSKGREEYEAALAAAPTNSEDAINNAAELNDKVKELEQSFLVLKTEVIGNIAPALTAAATTLEKLISSVTEYLKTDEGQELLQKMGEAVEGLFSDLSKIDPQQVVSGFTEVFTTIVDGLKWLSENSGTVIGAMEAIVIGWGALKITGGALKVWEIITGLKGLGGGGLQGAIDAASGGSTAGGASGNAAGAAAGATTKKAIVKGAVKDALKTAAVAYAAYDLVYGSTVRVNENIQEQADKINEELDRQKASFGGGSDPELVAAWKEIRERANEKGFLDELAERYYKFKKSADVSSEYYDYEDPFWDPLFYDYSNGSHANITDDTWNALTDMMENILVNHRMEEQGWESGAFTFDLDTTMKLLNQVEAELAKAANNQEPEVPVQPTVDDAAVQNLEEQVGTITIPATLALISPITGEEDGEHANGLWSVPFDGYRAILHKGERIVPAREARANSYSSNLYVESMYMNNGTDAEGLAAAMAAAQRRTMSGYGS